jgi:DNA-binding MarR family transcriptional regulator
MAEPLTMDEDSQLWVLVFQTRDLIFKLRQRELRQYRISVEEAASLGVLNAIGDKATPAIVARWMIREHHSVLGIMSRMEKRGLVKKTKDLERKNIVRISLTEKGRQALEQSTKRESIHEIMSHMTEDERRELRLLLEKLRRLALKGLGIEQEPPFPDASGT